MAHALYICITGQYFDAERLRDQDEANLFINCVPSCRKSRGISRISLN